MKGVKRKAADWKPSSDFAKLTVSLDWNSPEEDLRAAGKVIQECFRVAIERRESWLIVPDAEVCESIAKNISGPLKQIGLPVGSTILGGFEAQAKKLRKLLREPREKIANRYLSRHYAGVPAEDNPDLEGVQHIEAVEKGIEFLLEHYGGRKVGKYTWHHLARYIMACSMRSVREDGEYVTAVNADDPMCKFVTEVLTRLGFDLTADGVTEALRGRRGKLSKKTKEGKK